MIPKLTRGVNLKGCRIWEIETQVCEDGSVKYKFCVENKKMPMQRGEWYEGYITKHAAKLQAVEDYMTWYRQSAKEILAELDKED
jgi:hypothetical protein